MVETGAESGARAAALMGPGAGVSVVVPTLREAENIPPLLARLAAFRRESGLDLEVIFVDDRSRDGSAEAVAAAGHDWARLVERDGPPGLSAAVIDGFRLARHPYLVCMDADLSHPPEAIGAMLLALMAGAQFAIGSRYVPGGSTDDDWGWWRYFNSRVATALARPLTRVSDPMSGFFALRKSDFDRAEDLAPVGYKIALELIVKCDFENVAEVPIHFADRTRGQTKLTLREQLKYLRHVRRLYIHRFANSMYFVQFLVVGASGVVVNFTVLTALLWLGYSEAVSLAGGIAVSVFTNFLLNRRFTFSYARDGSFFAQLAGFVVASSLGMVVNYTVALTLTTRVLPDTGWAIYAAAATGIAAGMIFNFLGNRFVVFRKRHIRPRE